MCDAKDRKWTSAGVRAKHKEVRIAPPLNVTRSEIDEGLKSIDASFAAFAEVTS
jgi:4-aminobutyrate aminotransferase-like enzyme